MLEPVPRVVKPSLKAFVIVLSFVAKNLLNKIKIAVAGIGNCFSTLYQGLHFYKEHSNKDIPGIMFEDIGGYRPTDIEIVAAFDVDSRKVGKPVGEAIFAPPNCCRVFHPNVDPGVLVQKSHVLDGVSLYMLDQPEDRGFRVDYRDPEIDIGKVLDESGADILLNYLPVGSQKATEYLAEQCLKTKVAFLNCIPVFIASDPLWEERFYRSGIPIIGDDMKSQFGASIISQALQELALNRGMNVQFHSQINVGGNTDFNNMMVQERFKVICV